MTSPKLSYTIWMTQRVGSSWLCDMLSRQGNAGMPGEHLNFSQISDVQVSYGSSDPDIIRQRVISVGSTANGVFGIKQGFCLPRFRNSVAALDAGVARGETEPDITCWHALFPNHRHIFLTRRNKLRLAVSWWKAIQTGQSRLLVGENRSTIDPSNAYNYEALVSLLAQAVAREAGIGEMLNAARVSPLNVFYEDLCLDPGEQLQRVMDYLDLPLLSKPESYFVRQADDVNEEWVQRLRSELQQGWENTGW